MQPRRFHRPRFRFALLFSLLAVANVANAQSGGASITLQPVPPKTVPPSDYPPGTTIVGSEINLGSVPARVWLEVHVTGWAPEQLKYAQVKLNQYGSNDGEAGFDGANAKCGDEPAVGAEDLRGAFQSCSTTADCRASMSGRTSSCQYGEPVSCIDGYCNFVVHTGFVRSPGFMDRCDPAWIGKDVPHLSALHCDPECVFGVAVESNFRETHSLSDFHPSYLGTMVVDVPANAKGTYTIGYKVDETFLLNGNAFPNSFISASLIPAKITVPCGRCCHGVATDVTGCIERVSAIQCATNAPSAVFQPNENCPASGGPACPACALDEHCDDGAFCNGVEVCEASGFCGPGTAPCAAYEACEEDTDACAPRIPTVTFWGMIVLTFLLMIAAKLSYRRMAAASGDSAR